MRPIDRVKLTVYLSDEENRELVERLKQDELTFKELVARFVQSYVRRDRIAQMLLAGHRDAFVIGKPVEGMLPSLEREELLRQLEKEEENR